VDYPESLIKWCRERQSSGFEFVPFSEVEVDPEFKFLRVKGDAVTCKFFLVGTEIFKSLFPDLARKAFRNFIPARFWFPLRMEIKKDGLPVGMGKYLIMVNPSKTFENGNLLIMNVMNTEENVIIDAYSLWDMENRDKNRIVEDVAGTVMDRCMELMPFLKRHLLHLYYPEKPEEIPTTFFNHIYRLRRSIGLFSPAVSCKVGKNVFLVGPELFPQWGLDGEAMSAEYVIRMIEGRLSH
jgi:hypothetical protein